MGLRDRISVLERRAAGVDLRVIMILGGLPDGMEPRTAQAGEHQWTQEPGEAIDDFKTRVVSAARSAGMTCVAIGGLPDELG